MPDNVTPFPPSQTHPTGEPGGDPRRDIGTRASLTLAWLATVVVIAATVFVQSVGGRKALTQGAPGQAATLPDEPPGGLAEIMSRYLVGAKTMFPGGAAPSSKELMGPLAQFEEASPTDALRIAVAAAELDGASAAIDRLTTLADNPKASETLRREAAALAAMYAADDKQAAIREMDPSIRGGLTDRHGWFGDLALSAGMADTEPARAAVLSRALRTVVTLVSAVVLVGIVGVIGLVLLILATVKRSKGGLRDRYHPPAAGGSVYLETFAIFLAGFLLLIPLGALIENIAPGAGDLVTWLLLLVPLWPLARGTPWSKHRYAMGWHGGSGVAREVGAGLLGYIAGLPIFGLGVMLTLIFAFADSLIRKALGMHEGGPLSHPIVQEIAQGGVWAKVKLISLAVIWAPLVEESMFRGALYHHMRGGLRPLVSGLIVGFVFAVIHPQGIVAVPALMALAVVFALMREWRGSIIAPITAHALHNGTLMTLMLVAMS